MNAKNEPNRWCGLVSWPCSHDCVLEEDTLTAYKDAQNGQVV